MEKIGTSSCFFAVTVETEVGEERWHGAVTEGEALRCVGVYLRVRRHAEREFSVKVVTAEGFDVAVRGYVNDVREVGFAKREETIPEEG